MKKIGIIGAMELEVEELKSQMEEVCVKEKASMEFYQGTLNGKEVVVVRSGIGKVNAAVCTQILVDDFQAEAVINTGIAGSLKAEINIGDIVVSTDALQHDMDAREFGYPKEEAGKETEATAGCACSSFIPTGGRSPYTRSLRCWASFPRRSAYRSARNPTTISPSRWIKSRYRNRDSFLRRGQRMPSVSAAGRVSGIPYSRMRAGFFFERIRLAFLQP